MNKIKIAMIIPSWGKRCGVAEYTKSLTESLREHTDVTVYGDSIRNLSNDKRILEADLVHIQYEYSLYNLKELTNLISMLSKNRVPYVLTLHSYSPNLTEFNIFLSALPAVVVHTDRMFEMLCSHGWPRSYLHTIPMGVKTYRSTKSREQIVKELGGLGEPSVGFMGFMHWYKGLIPLVKAINLLHQRFPNIKCFIHSGLSENSDSQDFYKEFLKYIQTLKCVKNICLSTNFMPEQDLVEYLSVMDVNILPYTATHLEYFSTSAAVRTLFSAGSPVITSNSPFFEDLHDVFKLEKVGPQAIANAITYFLNPSVQAAYGEKSRNYAQKYSWAVSAQKHIELYCEQIKKT